LLVSCKKAESSKYATVRKKTGDYAARKADCAENYAIFPNVNIKKTGNCAKENPKLRGKKGRLCGKLRDFSKR